MMLSPVHASIKQALVQKKSKNQGIPDRPTFVEVKGLLGETFVRLDVQPASL